MSLPLSESQCKTAANWLRQNFEEQIKEQVYNLPWSVELVCAIFCQETAYKVLKWINNYHPLTILQRCVFDASGDFPGTVRFAFPKNKIEFEKKYGAEVTKTLIYEGNKQRAMPQWDAPKGYSEADYLYKGYGIFQYDLQNIETDPEFFLFKKWYNFSDCMQRLVNELNAKAKIAGNLHGIVKAYNGSGNAAEEYANNVLQFKEWITV
jgi:hypothetical protein